MDTNTTNITEQLTLNKIIGAGLIVIAIGNIVVTQDNTITVAIVSGLIGVLTGNKLNLTQNSTANTNTDTNTNTDIPLVSSSGLNDEDELKENIEIGTIPKDPVFTDQ
jgi:hypothetical protein